MNYYSIRIIMIIVVGLVIVLINRFIIKTRTKKTFRIVCVIALISYFAIYLFPFERFIKFDTIQKVFNYYYPTGDLIREYKFENYAYVLFSNGKAPEIIYYVKKDNNWKFDNFIKKEWGTLKTFGGYFIYLKDIPQKNVTCVTITYPDFIAKDAVVSDSLNSAFDKVVYQKNNKHGISYVHVAIINKKLDNNYTLNINGNDYRPFK